MRLAEDNYYAKQELRELFRKSPVWDEKLDALIINETRTHEPDYKRIRSLAVEILERPIQNSDDIQYNAFYHVIQFFSDPNLTDEEKAESIAAIQKFAPKAYAPGKKLTRVFKALCTALGVNDETSVLF